MAGEEVLPYFLRGAAVVSGILVKDPNPCIVRRLTSAGSRAAQYFEHSRASESITRALPKPRERTRSRLSTCSPRLTTEISQAARLVRSNKNRMGQYTCPEPPTTE